MQFSKINLKVFFMVHWNKTCMRQLLLLREFFSSSSGSCSTVNARWLRVIMEKKQDITWKYTMKIRKKRI